MCLPGAILAICIGYQAKLHNTSKFKHETFFAILKCISHENASLMVANDYISTLPNSKVASSVDGSQIPYIYLQKKYGVAIHFGRGYF